MRLIDAEPLVKLLHSRCTQLSNDYGSLAGAVSGCLRLLQSQPTISALINEPLTQEELRKMDGKPVWVEIPEGRVAEWCIAKWDPLMGRIRTCIHNRLSKVRKWEILTIVSAEETEIS